MHICIWSYKYPLFNFEVLYSNTHSTFELELKYVKSIGVFLVPLTLPCWWDPLAFVHLGYNPTYSIILIYNDIEKYKIILNNLWDTCCSPDTILRGDCFGKFYWRWKLFWSWASTWYWMFAFVFVVSIAHYSFYNGQLFVMIFPFPFSSFGPSSRLSGIGRSYYIILFHYCPLVLWWKQSNWIFIVNLYLCMHYNN